MTMTRHRSGAALSALVLALTFALAHPALGQEDASRAMREREALRRAQAALKVSQEHEAVLLREKSDITAEKDKLGNVAKRTESQLAATRSDASRLRTESARLQLELTRVAAELDAVRIRDETEKKSAQARVDELTRRLEDAGRVSAERMRTVISMTSLLERATLALAAADKANREMYVYGLEMIEQIRVKIPADTFVQSEPVLGFSRVRLENLAEELKDRLGALRLPAKQ